MVGWTGEAVWGGAPSPAYEGEDEEAKRGTVGGEEAHALTATCTESTVTYGQHGARVDQRTRLI